MTEQRTPITLEDAGARFGGSGKPWSRKTVERVIEAGLLFDYGYGATRRVILEEVDRLIERFATGDASWPLRKTSQKNEEIPVQVPSMRVRKDRGGGSRRSESKERSNDDERLVSKPPMRNLQLLKN